MLKDIKPLSELMPTHVIVVSETDPTDSIFTGPITDIDCGAPSWPPSEWRVEIKTITGYVWFPMIRCYPATETEMVADQITIDFMIGSERMSNGPRDMYLAILSTQLGRDIRLVSTDRLVEAIEKHGLYRVIEARSNGFDIEIEVEWVDQGPKTRHAMS